MNMHDSIVKNWQQKAEAADDRSFRFFRWLKLLDSKRVDRIAKETHAHVFEEVNCTKCANCCRTLKAEFRSKDVMAASAHLGMAPNDFTDKYLLKNKQGNLEVNALPCPFLLAEGLCNIYEVRPEGCRDFPHTHKSSFASRSMTHSANVSTCPAVFEILERMQERMNYRDRG